MKFEDKLRAVREILRARKEHQDGAYYAGLLDAIAAIINA